MTRTCAVCHRERFIPDHYGACPSCLDAALTAAYRTTTEARLGHPLPSRASAEARPSRTGCLSPNSGNLARASG